MQFKFQKLKLQVPCDYLIEFTNGIDFLKHHERLLCEKPDKRLPPTSKTAFMWHIEKVKGSPVICQSVPQSRPEGQVNVFIPGLQGRNSHREVKRPAPGLPEWTAELGLRRLGSLSLISMLRPPGKPSPSGTTAQLRSESQ